MAISISSSYIYIEGVLVLQPYFAWIVVYTLICSIHSSLKFELVLAALPGVPEYRTA